MEVDGIMRWEAHCEVATIEPTTICLRPKVLVSHLGIEHMHKCMYIPNDWVQIVGLPSRHALINRPIILCAFYVHISPVLPTCMP